MTQTANNQITNKTAIVLPAAAWLATDDYTNGSEHSTNGLPTLSATTLIKPIRQSVLKTQLEATDTKSPQKPDVSDFIAQNLGRSVHGLIQSIWENPNKWKPAMARLGYTANVINRIAIQPTPQYLADNPDAIPVYIEGRTTKVLSGYNITGMYDFIFNGELVDFKTTATFTYTSGNKKEDYILQGSIYRWLNPELIKADHIKITYIFTDWQAMHAGKNGYPKYRMVSEVYPLLSIEATETWLKRRLVEYTANLAKDQFNMVKCTDAELWVRTDYKYWKDPAKAMDPAKNRCTKNFYEDHVAAQAYLLEQKQGMIVPITQEPKACNYCQSRHACLQYGDMVRDGRITPKNT